MQSINQKKMNEFNGEHGTEEISNEQNFKIMKEKIKNMRKAALLSGDEFSFDNLVFKSLRSEGIFDKMNKYLEKIRDKKLSL